MIQFVSGLIAAHPMAAVLVTAFSAFGVFNAAVQALEKPTENSGPGYRFLYRFAHGLAFNFQYALRSKFPQYVPDTAKSVDQG